VSVFLSALIHHLIGLTLAVAAVAIVMRQVSPMIAFLPVYMFLVGLFSIGLGWIVSSLNVYVRDTAQILSVVLTLWFWATPIFISEQQIPQRFRFVVHGNPLSLVVRAYRERLMTDRWPDFVELAAIATYASCVFVLGGLFFRYLKRGFADVL
jgi:lipopolysaccharide transport system permease protein